MVLLVYPVMIGTGKRLFAAGTPARSFELVSTKGMPSGIAICSHRIAGPLHNGECGPFGLFYLLTATVALI